MPSPPADQTRDWANAALETSLGAMILTVRRLNILRRGDSPAAGLLDAGMDAVGDAIPAVTDITTTTMMAASMVAPEPLRDALLSGRDAVAKAPDVARLAGLVTDD